MKRSSRTSPPPQLTAAEIKAECQRIWNEPGVCNPCHKNKATVGRECDENGVFFRNCISLSRGAIAPALRSAETNRQVRFKRLVKKQQRLK